MPKFLELHYKCTDLTVDVMQCSGPPVSPVGPTVKQIKID